MQQHVIRSSLIVVLTVLAIFLLAPSTASAGSCVSEGNAAWEGGFTCDGVPDQTPTMSDAVTILPGHTITIGDYAESGAITVQFGATLVVSASSSIAIYSDVTVYGIINGDFNSYLYFYGTVFTNNGSLTNLINVYYFGTGSQTISGAGSWTSTGRLHIGYHSVTTLANDMTMAFSQYGVGGEFSLDDHTLTFDTPGTLTLTNGGIFDIGSQTLAFHAPSGATYYSNYGTIIGTGIFQTSGAVSLTSYDTFSASLELASGTTTTAGEINGPITVHSGATLMVQAGTGLITSADITVYGIISGGDSNSYIYSVGPTVTNNDSLVAVANVYFAGGPHTLQGTGSFSNNVTSVFNGAVVNLGSDHQMSTVVVTNEGALHLSGHTLSLSGTGTPLTNNGTFDTTASTVIYNGTESQTVATTNVHYYSLGVDNATGVTLGGSGIVLGSLILTSGRFTLGGHTLTLGDAATIGGVPSASAMVVADGEGFLRKTSAGPLSFTFPVGDSSGAYTPVSLDCTTFPAGGAVDARLRDAVHPVMTGDTYLTRYWTLASDATDAGCTGVFTYAQDDVVGVETNLIPAKYDGAAWSVLGSGVVNTAANTLTGSFESFSDFTGGEGSALAIYLSSFSAEPMRESILVSWETVSEVNNQGFNLYRNTGPIPADEPVAFIPSQAPGSSQGFAYEWIDNDVVSGQTYYYWLEDIDLNGTTTLHGPVSATVDVPTAVTISGLHSSSQSTDGWLAELITAVKAFVTTSLSR